MTIPNIRRTVFALAAIAIFAGCARIAPAGTSTPALPTSTPGMVFRTPAIESPAVATAAPGETSQTPQEIVSALVGEKLAALQSKDIDQYLSLIHAQDKEFFTEQRNWFLIYQVAVTSDFSIEVQQVERIDEATLVATFKQDYLYGVEKSPRSVVFAEKYVLTEEGWKDADLNFSTCETAHFKVKFMPADARKGEEVCQEAEKAYASVAETLQLEPPQKVIIKLYPTQELLRQSTDIRVRFLFNGWNEDRESIKLYAQRERSAFAPVIAHELTHQITLGISDSLNSWFAEGLAGYFGNQPLRGGNPLELGWYTPGDLSEPIRWLEETNLIRLTDGETIRRYYAVSSLVIEFIVDTYGLESIHALLDELSKFPRYDHGFDYERMEVENTARLHQAMETVLGLNQEALDQEWLAWIAAQE